VVQENPALADGPLSRALGAAAAAAGVKRVPAAVGVPGGRISNRRKATDTCAPHFSD
jgi:hypothetical protein